MKKKRKKATMKKNCRECGIEITESNSYSVESKGKTYSFGICKECHKKKQFCKWWESKSTEECKMRTLDMLSKAEELRAITNDKIRNENGKIYKKAREEHEDEKILIVTEITDENACKNYPKSLCEWVENCPTSHSCMCGSCDINTEEKYLQEEAIKEMEERGYVVILSKEQMSLLEELVQWI